jgi:hypothetical protein
MAGAFSGSTPKYSSSCADAPRPMPTLRCSIPGRYESPSHKRGAAELLPFKTGALSQSKGGKRQAPSSLKIQEKDAYREGISDYHGCGRSEIESFLLRRALHHAAHHLCDCVQLPFIKLSSASPNSSGVRTRLCGREGHPRTVSSNPIRSPQIRRRHAWMDRRSSGSGLGGPAESVGPHLGWDER